jgi:hypothetical protein
MASTSSLSAPGIEVREYDESLRITSNTGTTVFVPGYAAQGPVEEVLQISSINDFETIYGIPTTEAERYFYYTCLAILNNSGPGTTLLTSRLPYGPKEGDNVANAYTLLAYPAIPVIKNGDNEKGYDYFKYVASDETTTSGETNNFCNFCKFFALKNNIEAADHSNEEIIILSEFLSSTNSVTICSVETTNGISSINWRLDEDSDIKNSPLDLRLELGADKSSTVLHINAQLVYKDIIYGIFKADLSFNGELTDEDIIFPQVSEVSETIKPLQFTKVNAYKKAEKFGEPNTTYILGAPATFNVSLSEYYEIISEQYFTWSNTIDEEYYKAETAAEQDKFGKDLKDTLSQSAFIAINTSRSIINDMYEGYYLGITDNVFNTPSDEYKMNSISDIRYHSWNRGEGENSSNSGIVDIKDKDGENKFTSVSRARLDFYLDSSNKGSLSHTLQTTVTSFDTSSDEYDDTINFGIFKLAKSTNGTELMRLNYSIVEKYNAAFGKTRKYSTGSSTTPQNYFIENIVENSRNIAIMVNPYIGDNIKMDFNNNLTGKVRTLSSKNIDAYSTMEKKFLASPVSSYIENDTTKRKHLTENNIKNWVELNKKMGISLSLLKELAGDTLDRFNLNNALYPFATYSEAKKANKYIGNTPAKIKRALELISNDEEYPDIDILVEGGLGTVYTYSSNSDKLITENNAATFVLEKPESKDEFNPSLILQGIEDLRTSRSTITIEAEHVISSYLDVQNAFMSLADSFQNGGRGDTFYISDVLRGILLHGENVKVEKLFGTELKNNVYTKSDEVKHSWATSIYNPIKHTIESFTTSYASIYAQWVKVLDTFTNEKCWMPVSGYMAALMCAADQLQGPWYAAAGLNRGIVQGVLDCAINPNQKQRGDLYKICVNSVPKIANVGITSWGIRTLSKKASAFDQNTCRRTFLFIEKAIKKLLRYYIFEPNNSYTQLSIYNEIQPYMESIRNQGGIYSYSVVVDASNNTPEIINAGNLAVDVSAAPTRTAEFIVLNMTANKYTNEVSTNEFNG